MKNKNKKFQIIIVLFFLVVLGFVWFWLGKRKTKLAEEQTIKEIKTTVDRNLSKKGDQIDLKKLNSEYKNNIKQINKFLRDFSFDNSDFERLADFQKNLLSLKVPKEFKDLHLSLMIALNKLKDYDKNKDEEKKQEFENIINEIQTKYVWLNE